MNNNMIRRLLGRSRQQAAQQADRPQSRRSAPADARASADGMDASAPSNASAPPSPRHTPPVPSATSAAPATRARAPEPPSPQAARRGASENLRDAVVDQRDALPINLGAAAIHFLGHLFLARILADLPPDGFVISNGSLNFRRMGSRGLTIEGDALFVDPDGIEDDMDGALQFIQEDEERAFQENFALAHQGSVGAMRQTIDALWARPQAQVPAEGITQTHIADRDWRIMYKLPALMLAQQLPKLCAGRGVLSHIALFDQPWQKQKPQSDATYPSALPKIYGHLLAMHKGDVQALQAALPALVERVSFLLESGNSEATPETDSAEDSSGAWQLAKLIREAVHHIDGQVLYETLGQAHAHLPGA